MPNILIICPTFTPLNTPDHHRIRLSIPWFQKFGWKVTVLAVKPEFTECPLDPILQQAGDPCETIRVNAFPVKWTRKIGLGNLGYRSWFYIKSEGESLIKRNNYDLIYFSTTVFPIMTLGRIWKKKFKIPYILDIQDPWRNDFYLDKPKDQRPPKYKIAHFLDSLLEKWTIPHANGLISVSDAYPSTLNKRYNTKLPSSVIPFASSKADFELVEKLNVKNPLFKRKENRIHVVYTGAVTPGMPKPLYTMFKAFKHVISSLDNINIHIYFVGSSYASKAKSIALPIAKNVDIEKYITELPERVGYFEAIKIMQEADIIILPGSMESGYTASKIYPYILSEKTIIALTHELSSVSAILKGCNAGPVITFNNEQELLSKSKELEAKIKDVIINKRYSSEINWNYYNKYSDKQMAINQITFFNKILNSK